MDEDDDPALIAFVTQRAKQMGREDLEAAYVEAVSKHYQLSMRRAEIRGPVIEEMKRLLHNARYFYSRSLEHRKGLMMTWEDMEEAVREITAVLDGSE